MNRIRLDGLIYGLEIIIIIIIIIIISNRHMYLYTQ